MTTVARAATPSTTSDSHDHLLDVEQIRSQFPVTRRSIYLNTAGLGPNPRPVMRTFQKWYRKIEEEAPDSPDLHRVISPLYNEAHGKLGALLGADEDELAFTRNANDAFNIIANGLTWNAGDEVIISEQEHPSGVLPWAYAADRYGVVVKRVPLLADPDEQIAALEKVWTPRTRLFSLSWMPYSLGLRIAMPEVVRWARDHEVLSLVDCSQIAGQWPVNLHDLGCDFAVAPGHKWIFGPLGSGWTYIRRDHDTLIKPSWIGAGSTTGPWDINQGCEFRPGAWKHEFGTRNWPTFIGLGAAADYVRKLGPQNIAATVAPLASWLKAELKKLPGIRLITPEDPALSAGIVSFAFADGRNPHEFGIACWERRKLAVRITPTFVRVSIAIFINQADCEVLLDELHHHL